MSFDLESIDVASPEHYEQHGYPRAVQGWEAKVRRITRDVIDAAAQREQIDFVQDVSAPITIAVIALMLGVPEHDWPLLFRWTNEIIAPEDPEFQRDGDKQKTFD